MSATPIFEQLCRDLLDDESNRPPDVTEVPIVSQRKAPAHSLENAGMSDRRNYQSRALAEWACPAN